MLSQEQFDAMWAGRFQTFQEETNRWAECREVFGLGWKLLSLDEGAQAIADVDRIAKAGGHTFRQGAILLRRTIGGPQGLKLYTKDGRDVR